MSVVGANSIFTAMKQNGPFRVNDDLSYGHVFTAHSRNWIRTFCLEPVTVTKYRAVREHIFDLLQVDNYQDIPKLFDKKVDIIKRSQRAYTLLGNLYGIQGDANEIQSRIKSYASSADAVISYLKNKVLNNQCSNIELSNEIETTHNPVELLLIIFNPQYHKKSRFEAKRKLVLMGLAASIDQRERETDIENKFSNFLNFLNRYVWSPALKIGELQNAYLHSFHDLDEFSCTKVDIVENIPGKLGEREKLTMVKRRLFQFNDKHIPVYVTVRKKDSAAKILKLLRKNEKNPAVAVDDELGLMAVLDCTADIKHFVKHLTKSAVKADSIMVLEDITDTLTGGYYHASSTGSNSHTPMLKFFARLGGMRVEFIIHTNETYLNYRYQRGVAHDEYEVRRLFDSGVAEFLFPEDIYQIDMSYIKQSQLDSFRKKIES
ncbi:MAG: hypothetical protein HQL46_03065 [Gammaproteobacteria bacterium]|nr:hypothetical protein [Gammaproteobacteria bacterium]